MAGDTYTLVSRPTGSFEQKMTPEVGGTMRYHLKHWQDGKDMMATDQVYVAVGSKIYESAPGSHPPTTYDKRSALVAEWGGDKLTWTAAKGSQVWTPQGVPMELGYQMLRYHEGQSSVLYLHFENLLAPENSRGPDPHSSTCAAKLTVDPSSFVNNVVQTRAHRWVEIPPGTISLLKFFLRRPKGDVVDIVKQGCSISFILTIAPRGSS